MRRQVDRPDGEEQRDLGKRVPDQVQDRPGPAAWREQRHPQHHVRELPDRGVGQDALEVVQTQRVERGDEDRD